MIEPMTPARLVLPLLLLLPASGCLLGGDDQGDAGSEEGLAMDEGNEGTVAADGTTVEECFLPPHCDPLSPNCANGEICSANQGTFDCTVVPEGTELVGDGEECGAASCEEGLVCSAIPVPGCSGGVGCCVPLCDLEQPQCSAGMSCSAYYSEGSSQCYANVGVCTP
jgi:hypothetical protein